MIDWHCHILPGLDDGPIDIDESIAMAALLAEFGYRTVCCTPHRIKGYYDHTQQQVREATMLLQADLDNAGIQLDLWPGMEYMLDEIFAASATIPMTLGDTRLVLCEAPQQVEPAIIIAGLQRILAAGKIPLIAHPERTQYFFEILVKCEERSAKCDEAEADSEPEVERIEEHRPQGFFASLASHLTLRTSRFALRKSHPRPVFTAAAPPVAVLPEGVLFQANLGSFTGFYGPEVLQRAYQLLKSGTYTCLASDLHNSRSATAVLMRDKLETNPLLQRLAGFNGVVGCAAGESGRMQGELF